VYAGPAVNAAERASIEAQAGYITRPVLAMDALANHADGRLVIETPPDPKTSATSIDLDPLEWIHRITSHIPDPGRHYQRFYGAYSTAGGFAWHLKMKKRPAWRQGSIANRTCIQPFRI